jgi:hypothetical protein
MAWSGLLGNQMVTFTDAQGGGFALKAGQSAVTSNQCMTKDAALAKYNVKATDMSAYASNQLVPKSAWVQANLYNGILTVGTIGTATKSYGWGSTSDTGPFGAISPNSISFMYPTATISSLTKYGSSNIILLVSNIPNTISPLNWTSISINGQTLLRVNATIIYSPTYITPSQQSRRFTWTFTGNPFGTTVGVNIPVIFD